MLFMGGSNRCGNGLHEEIQCPGPSDDLSLSRRVEYMNSNKAELCRQVYTQEYQRKVKIFVADVVTERLVCGSCLEALPRFITALTSDKRWNKLC